MNTETSGIIYLGPEGLQGKLRGVSVYADMIPMLEKDAEVAAG